MAKFTKIKPTIVKLTMVKLFIIEPTHSQMDSHFGVPMHFQVFKKKFQRLKLIELKSYLYHWKRFEN